MGISLLGDIFGLVDSGGSCISTVAMVRACEAIQARLVATLSIVRELYPVVRQNEIVSSHEVKSRANLSRPVVVAAQWVNQHEIMLGFEAVQERSLPDPWNQLIMLIMLVIFTAVIDPLSTGGSGPLSGVRRT